MLIDEVLCGLNSLSKRARRKNQWNPTIVQIQKDRQQKQRNKRRAGGGSLGERGGLGREVVENLS